jgi:hypothetical protein
VGGQRHDAASLPSLSFRFLLDWRFCVSQRKCGSSGAERNISQACKEFNLLIEGEMEVVTWG